MSNTDRIVLIGFSGTGKTTVARALAERLGWSTADSDAEIERQWGATIPAIFRNEGEAAFRSSERAILGQLLARNRVVIATGGGAPVDPQVWNQTMLGSEGTLVIALDASPETILDRLQRQAADEGEAVERPLLAGSDRLERIRDLKAARQSIYDWAHLTISSEGISADAVAAEIAALSQLREGDTLGIHLDAASGESDIRVGPGAISRIGEWVRDRWPRARRSWIVTDRNVRPLHAAAAESGLRAAGFAVSTRGVAPGEGSKSLATTAELYDWLLD
ncbi:MAG TPA: shikimate kinase, partial [Thermomicrobiales bacterium]|nr:shikimate kinase [Thermomicrobiales bacterium]